MRPFIARGLFAALILANSAAAAQNAATGPSTRTAPYLKPLVPGVSFTSLLTAGDEAGRKPDGTPWRMAGLPDGLGAYDNGDGTISVLIDHEFKPTAGVVRAHGAAGAFVSKLVVDKASLKVLDASDLIQTVKTYNPATKQYETSSAPLGALCSADLPGGSAFYDPASKLGYEGQVFLSGEEMAEGRPFAHFATGEAAGNSYELAWLGNMAFENVVAHPGAGQRTVVAMTDDSHPLGQIYFYVGEKRASGDPVEKAGLAHGRFYGLKVAGMPVEPTDKTPEGPARFTLVEIGEAGDVSALTAKEIDAMSEAQAVTEFQRPEDGAWDRRDPNRFFFNATADFGLPSRLWSVTFDDIAHPEKGGTVVALLKGAEFPEGLRENYHMLDNMAVAADGQIILQEDPGRTPYLAHMLQFDPKTSKLVALAEFDGDLFKEGGLSIDEESSGVIDVTPLLGSAKQRAFLLTVQPHFDLEPKGEIVQGGQLVLMRQDIP